MNCCRCGKSFDYEKHNGICPKCAAYNRPQGQTPYDYDVDKDISAHYETMDDSHERLHRMYDSAPAHQPEKQHAQYHRQYDNDYRHPQGAGSALDDRMSQSQGQSGASVYQTNPSQNAGGAPNYRMNPSQGMGGAPNYRTNAPQMQNGVPVNGAYQMQGQSGSAPNYRINSPQMQNGAPQNGGYPMQGAGGRNAPQGKKTRSVVGRVILTIFIIDIIIAFLQMVLQ
ncbi:MAG: hypothetical protein NC254_06625 [bacterium]|nr:hypothetical protein [bacterium]